jgi:hypothetical protein
LEDPKQLIQIIMRQVVLFILVIALTACQAWAQHCPTPETIRLKKASFNRVKWYKTQLEKRTHARKEAMAKHEQLLLVSDRKPKKIMDVEEWDCPRPGSKHDKLVAQSRKRLEKQRAHSLRKKNERITGDNVPAMDGRVE